MIESAFRMFVALGASLMMVTGCVSEVACSEDADCDSRQACNSGICGVSAEQLCIDRSYWSAVRDGPNGRQILSASEVIEALANATGLCESATWPAGCHPDSALVDRCIDELSAESNLGASTDSILSTTCSYAVLCD